jgi:site-specific DNA-methyltransferase (adenine-specific)
MKPTLTIRNAVIYQGNNLEVLPTLPDNSVDSIVCDPPYELGFMGKTWDSSGIAYSVELWRECLRVLKPGGHLLAFGGTRTWHRLAVAVEDAGFEIRDNIAWLYGSGFPKSHNISKAIDKAAGAEREIIGHKIRPDGKTVLSARGTIDDKVGEGWQRPWRSDPVAVQRQGMETASATDDAKAWDGWGTALKPAHEPIVVARKPLIGTVAQNVLTYGVGGLNIDATRIPGEVPSVPQWARSTNNAPYNAEGRNGEMSQPSDLGRWPANIILDEYTAELLDEQADASRFFYVAKASKRDRNEGLENIEGKEIGAKGNGLARTCNTCNSSVLDECDCPDRTFSNPVRQNFHPTVKPTALMQYLIRLVTPANGVVLDPFAGSGSTGKAAILENKHFIGIELTAEYLPIIEGRLTHAYETLDSKEDLF